MEFVAAAARHDVDGSAGANTRGEVEIHARHLEFLNDFLREILLSSAGDGVAHAGAIHGDARQVGIRAKNRDVESAIILALAVSRHADARLKHGELKKAASVQRKILDLLAGYDTVDGMPLVFNLRSNRFDGDD